ncbi:CDC73-domain-containing protein [Exidia glandulosa HHB12029]|uniref:CDC73-domain-containing protein n=1 Tax=Exidia glandulosa HHB12029 TaxID=1314781 RepID=A0A165EG02_EXIGL|nr:CDC73-domain-containing protein [Exidia glandulosa HHB12029]
MSSTPDPLVALRDAIKNKAAITYLADDAPTPLLQSATHISIPTTGTEPLVVPKTTPSRFRKPSSDTEFYAIGAVLACWLFRDAGAAEYMRASREAGYAAGFVSVTERKGIVDWLEGRRAQHDRLASFGRAEGSGTPPGSPKRSAPTGAVTRPDAPVTPAKRRYEPDKADVEAVKRIRQTEVELRDRNTVLRGVKANNFTSVKNSVSDKLKKLKESSKPGQGAARDTAAPKPDPKMANKKRTNYPIIIISSSPTSLITMHNVKKLLEESVFMTSDQAREQEGGGKPEDVIAIYRKKTNIGPGGKEITSRMRYFVVDSVEALAKFGGDPWDRVVCVMTTGQAWQFRPYKWSEPLQLFHNVKGFYVSWSNDPPNPKIKDWNVSEMKIDQYKRHVDKSVVAHFWQQLDAWVAQNKPTLAMS